VSIPETHTYLFFLKTFDNSKNHVISNIVGFVFWLIARSSFWACCAAPPPPKTKKEKKVKKEKEKKDKKPKKEKKSKDSKYEDRHSLPDGFQCNGGDEVSPVVREQRDDVDQQPPEGKS